MSTLFHRRFFQQTALAGRSLLRDLPFSLLVTVILTLGLAANISIFSVLQAILLRPLPYPQPQELLTISSLPPNSPASGTKVASSDFFDWREQSQTLDSLAAYYLYTPVLTGIGEPENLNAAAVIPGFFSVLRLPLHLGRVFTPEDSVMGRNDFAILSHGLWQRRFGGDPQVVGNTLRLDDEIYQIVGVASPEHEIPSHRIQIYLPLAFSEEGNNRHTLFLTALARRHPEFTLEQVRSEMDALSQGLAEQYPQTNTGRGIRVIPLHEWRVGEVRPALQALQLAAGVLLLMICINVASLLLARVLAREKELAIHRALGATSWTLARRSLAEMFLLALAAGVLALPVSIALTRLLVATSPDQLPRIEQTGIDSSVVFVGLTLTLVTALLCGLLPALRSGRSSPQAGIRGWRLAHDRQQGRITAASALVVGEVALALCLLIGTGLLLRSLHRLEREPKGFDPENVLVVQVALPLARYPGGAGSTEFFSQLLEDLQALPASRYVGAVSGLPFQGGERDMDIEFEIEGRAEDKNVHGQRIVSARITTPDYFRALGIPLLAGRGLDDRDRQGQPAVAVINQSLARRLHSAGNAESSALGERLNLLIGPGRTVEVVGVVGDTRYEGLERPPKPELFLSFRQVPTHFASVVVRADSEPLALIPSVEEKIWRLDPEQPILRALTMDQLVERSISERRFQLRLLAAFGAVALLLAVLGIYGLMVRRVASQSHEISVRLALGADGGQVRLRILGQALRLTFVGLAIGLVTAALSSHLAESLLFGVSPTDLLTFASASLALAVAAGLGSYLPALKASRTDPAATLRIGN